MFTCAFFFYHLNKENYALNSDDGEMRYEIYWKKVEINLVVSIICCIFVLERKKEYTDVLHNSQPKILGTYERGILL